MVIMDYRYTGIILGKRDVGETDRLYSIFTLEAGKIQALAKSVRKLEAKLAGFLENFTLTEIFIAKNQGSGKIKGSLVENNFSDLKKNYEALIKISMAVNMLDKLTTKENKDEKIFNLLKSFLEAMEETVRKKKEDKIDILALGFIFKLFEALGYKIEANHCSVCMGQLSKKNNFFSPENGGILCENCARTYSNNVRISNDSIKLIRIFYKNKIGSLSKLRVGKKEIDSLLAISSLFFKWIAS
jgi:DNA repair protein RecO (recombination protein O)